MKHAGSRLDSGRPGPGSVVADLVATVSGLASGSVSGLATTSAPGLLLPLLVGILSVAQKAS